MQMDHLNVKFQKTNYQNETEQINFLINFSTQYYL